MVYLLSKKKRVATREGVCMQKDGREGRRMQSKKVKFSNKSKPVFFPDYFLIISNKNLLLKDELVKRGNLYLKSLVWHEFMVPCRRYWNEGWLGFQLVCEHKGMVHRYRSHLLRTHKVGWEHRDLGEETLRSGYFWQGNWGIAIHVGFQHCWRILEVIVVNIRTLRDGIDGASQLWPHHGAWGRGWLDTGLQGVC